MKGFARVEEEVLEPIDLIWFDWPPQVLVWLCKWENFEVHLYPKKGFRESCMDAHVDHVIFGNQNLLSIPLYVTQVKIGHLSINTYFFYLLFHLPKMR